MNLVKYILNTVLLFSSIFKRMSGVGRLTNLTSDGVLRAFFYCWSHQMSSGASECLFIPAQNVSRHPPICRSAGQKLISMLMVLTNVLWSGCHFWADLNCPPELNCAVNYHIIAFSAVIYVHIGVGVLQSVGRGISAAGLTPNTAGCFSTSKHQSSPPAPSFSPPPSFCSFLLSFICSSALSPVLLAFIHSFFAFSFQFPYRRCFHLLLYTSHLPSSISAVFWRNDSEVPSGLYSSSASFIARAHTYTCERASPLLCHCFFLFPTRHLASWHSLSTSLSLCSSVSPCLQY